MFDEASVAIDLAETLAPPSQGHQASLADLLRSSESLSIDALDRALLVQRESGERLDAVLTRLGLISEQALADLMVRASGLSAAAPSDYPAERVAGPELPIAFLQSMRCVPLRRTDTSVIVAVASPFDDFVVSALQFQFGLPVGRRIGLSSDIDAAIERLYRPVESESEAEAVVTGEDLERLKDLVSDAPVIRAVNRLIARAADERASDIHIEPTEDSLAVRFRIDGILRDLPALPAAMRGPFISRVKIMANLNIAEKRLPQDGRLRLAVRGHEIDLRVATAPSIYGESAVLRILDRSKLTLDLGVLGFREDLAARFRQAVGAPYGIVLVTGPTGSGKTTTLYAALAEINRRERKLLTIEDPIEYRLPGVIQAQVNPAIGFTFGSALRSFLRQDPDVIMVGEIRDSETAEIAIQAALTGHMILSTLHTNTAAGAVTRLLDMGVEPFLLSSVLTAVVAQRLVRRLCVACREPVTPPQEMQPLFAGVGMALPDVVYRPVGCTACSGSGYVGRMAVFDFLQIDDAVGKLILARSDSQAIAAAATGGGSIAHDGLRKAAAGDTSVEEVLRVVAGD